MTQLEELLRIAELRNELVESLLNNHQADAVRRIRFFCAVSEILRTEDKNDRSFKAAKVVQAFVKPNGRYTVDGIPATIASELRHHRMSGFRAVGVHLLEDLVALPVVTQALTTMSSPVAT
jgi:hypothetical protein